LQEYVALRLAEEDASATANRQLGVLKGMFRRGLESDPPKIDRLPSFPKKLRKANPRSGFITEEQYETRKAACKPVWLRALLALGYNFGVRKGELLGVLVHQIDLKARVKDKEVGAIRLLPGTTKNDAGRTIIKTQEVRGLGVECAKGKGAEEAVFTRANGRAVEDFREAGRL
jgi:integrase